MNQFRMDRVNAQVKKELGELVRQKLSVETHGLITITDVVVSKDLRNARVFYSVVGVRDQEEKAGAALESVRRDLQSALANVVKMKYTPQLSFEHDTGLERGIRVINLLENLEKPGSENSDADERDADADPDRG